MQKSPRRNSQEWEIRFPLNPFRPNISFPYRLKASEYQRLSDISGVIEMEDSAKMG